MYFMTNELMRTDEISGRWFPIIIIIDDDDEDDDLREWYYMLDN